MANQLRLDHSICPETEIHPEKPLADKTCGECALKHKYGRWWKCQFKPKGWGYDIRLKHLACGHFQPLSANQKPKIDNRSV